MANNNVYIRTNIEIEKELLDRFREILPQHGSIKWFVNECFRKFEERHNINLTEEIEDAVDAVLKELDVE